jgi:hypothetical protein
MINGDMRQDGSVRRKVDSRFDQQDRRALGQAEKLFEAIQLIFCRVHVFERHSIAGSVVLSGTSAGDGST